jgi:putative salt-induced outer membrane protein YdiY
MFLLALLLAQAAPAPVTWTGTVALGLIALTGNSQTVTFSTNGAFERKSSEWIWGIKASAAYGRATPATGGESQVTALAGNLQARGDRRFTDTLSLYLLLGIDADHLKSIEGRPTAEPGLSQIWFDEKVGDLQKTTFKTDLGLRVGREYRFQYYPTQLDLPDVDMIAPRLGAAYRYAFTKDVIFTEEASALVNVIGDTSGRTLLSSTTKLSSHITTTVAFGVGFAVVHDTQPPPAKVKTDTALTVGLEVGI